MESKSMKEFFELDHDRLDDLLKQFLQLKRVDPVNATACFVEFKVELQRHIVWEEDILFPTWEASTGMEGGPTAVMRAEHRQIEQALEAVHRKVRAQDPESDDEELVLRNLLKTHNEKEERILYPAIDSVLTAQDRTALYERMKSIPEERYQVCCGQH
jgi:Uncharacterized conserved protein